MLLIQRPYYSANVGFEEVLAVTLVTTPSCHLEEWKSMCLPVNIRRALLEAGNVTQ